ncbi:MAG: trigger factor [Saprospiraceae bacterium]
MSNAKLDRPSPTEINITVTLLPEHYLKPAKAELKKLASTAQIKGFRPGKVPASYMRKLYGERTVIESVSKAVDQAINDLIKEEKLDIFGQLRPVDEPDFEGLTLDSDKTLVFKYTGGIMPSTESVDVKGLKKISRYEVKLSDSEATEKLDEARKRFVDYAERDDVETDEDFATLVITDEELDAKMLAEVAEGEEAPKEERQRYFLRANDLRTKTAQKKLLKKKKGAHLTLTLKDLNEDIKERFDKVIEEDGDATFTIIKIDRESMPELGEDIFKKIFGEETTVSSEQEAKDEFSRRFAENSQSNLDDFALEQLIDKLADTNEVEAPMEAIKHRLVQAREEEAEKAKTEEREPEYTHDLTEADRFGLARRLKWMAFRQNLIKVHEVELDREDVDAGIEANYIKQLSGMGIDPEQYRSQFFEMFKKNLLDNREQVMEMTDSLINAKLLKKLEAEGVLGKRNAVSEKEFSDIIEAYNKDATAKLDKLREVKL